MSMSLKEIRLPQVKEMAEGGLTPAAIAEELGMALSTVYAYLAELGVKPSKGTHDIFHRLGDSKIDELLKLYETPMPVYQILNQFNITYNDLYRILRARGVQPRNRRNEVDQARKDRQKHALHLYQHTNLTIAQIVQETGIHQPELHRLVRENNIPHRRPRQVHDV